MVGRFVSFMTVLLAWRAGAAVTISEPEYLAEAHEPAVMALQGALATARGEESSARALANPSIALEREAPGESEQWTLDLSWTPPLDGRRGLGREAARAGVDAARGELDWARLGLRAEMRAAYAAWALAAERASIVQAQVAALGDIVLKAEERRRVGEESGLGAQRLALALVELEAALAQAEADLVASRAIALGRIEAAHIDPRPVLPHLPESPPDPGLGAHPRLEALGAELREAEARSRLGRRYVPAPELRIGWQSQEAPGFEARGLVAGVAWALPLFDRRQGERQEWDGRLRAARAGVEAEDRRAHARLAGTTAGYRRLRAAALATAPALAGSDRILEQAAARFQMGESDVTDLLDTMRSVLAARLAGLELYGAALAAHRDLELACGRALTEVERGGR